MSSIVEVETGFAFDLNGQIVQGNIDLLRRDLEYRVEIVDFKTSEMPANDDGIRKDSIDLQLDIYALGVEKALGFKVAKTTAHFLGDGNLLTTDWSSDRRTNALLRLSSVLDNIADGQFASNHDYCAYCHEFREICPYGQVIERITEEP